jgi:hypothetical protein
MLSPCALPFLLLSVLRRHPDLAAAHALEALRQCVTAARLAEGAVEV